MTVVDPWASPAEPEQPTPPPPAPAVVNNTSRMVSGSDEGKITTTLKGGRDFDAPWVVIHASSVEESDALLKQVFHTEYLDRVKKVAAGFAGAPSSSNSAPANTGNAQSRPARQAPQGALEPPSWFPAPPADDWVYKTGTGKNGVWHAWAPARKGEGEWEFHRPPRN